MPSTSQCKQLPMSGACLSLVQDFLRLCFQKDPRKRPSATSLLQHEWIMQNRRTVRNSWRKGQVRGLSACADPPPPPRSSSLQLPRKSSLPCTTAFLLWLGRAIRKHPNG